MEAECFAGLHPYGWGDGARNDDLSGSKGFSKMREKICDVTNIGDEFAGQSFKAGSAGHFRAIAKDTRI